MQGDKRDWQRNTKMWLLLVMLWLTLVPHLCAHGSTLNIGRANPSIISGNLNSNLTGNRTGSTNSATNCGVQQSTPLSPNSNAVTDSLQDINRDMTVGLESGGITYWTVLLSSANVDVSLAGNRGNAIVIFHRGLTVHMTSNGKASYSIFISGKITDDNTEYDIVGKLIGVFSC